MAGETGTPPGSGVAGHELRRQREMRGISVREIAEVTKISVRFLEAIENEDFGALPAPVFTRGFIREYARQIGIDPDEIIQRYARFVVRKRSAEEAEQAAMERRISGTHSLDSRWPLVMLTVLAFASLGVVIGLYSRAGSPSPPRERVVPRPESRANTETAPPLPDADSKAAPPPGVESARAATPGLRIVADEDCYLTLSIDGERVFSGEVLRAGETRQFDVAREIRFETVGNAGGIRVFLDGVEIPALGRPGEVVRNRTLDRTAIDR